MSKSKLLVLLTSASRLPTDLSSQRSAAEAALAAAECIHRKAVGDVHQRSPGAAQRFVEAVTTLRLAQENLRDIMAAQIELEAANVKHAPNTKRRRGHVG